MSDEQLQIIPFEFMKNADPASILNALEQEIPQTIAFVLSFLEVYKAAIIVEKLPTELRSEVIRRIAMMDYVHPEICREVEWAVEKKLSGINNTYIVNGGIDHAAEIMNFVDTASEKQIVQALEDEDPELAEEIKKRMFVFEDIVMLKDRHAKTILHRVAAKDLSLALKTVDSETRKRIVKNCGLLKRIVLKFLCWHRNSAYAKEAEAAQQKIISLVSQLEGQGKIEILKAEEMV